MTKRMYLAAVAFFLAALGTAGLVAGLGENTANGAVEDGFSVYLPGLSRVGAPPLPTATPTVPACEADATVTALDKVGEVVTVSGAGDMTEWYIISESGSQRFDFPDGFALNGSVQVRSATPQFANTPTMLWWSAANLWNNSADDDAFLYNCLGQLVHTFEDGD